MMKIRSNVQSAHLYHKIDLTIIHQKTLALWKCYTVYSMQKKKKLNHGMLHLTNQTGISQSCVISIIVI